jgi:sec-independent protein translocase protein TatA
VLSTIFSGGDDLIVILVAVVVLFGGKQLPKLAKNTGEALKEFRKAKTEAEAGQGAPVVAAVPVAAPVATPVLPAAAPLTATSQVAAAGPGASDAVTISRSELDALMAERASRAQAEGPRAES